MHERDIADLARLHVACLDDSLVGVLGLGYVRSFYQYVAHSDKEFVVVERDQADRIVAAAVVSLEPATLNRRLLQQTPLFLNMVRRGHRMLGLILWSAQRSRRASVPGPAYEASSRPELILIFTSHEERGTGRGSALLRQVESHLRARDVREYEVRTVSDPANPALSFYRERAFTPAGISYRLGTCFQVFTRSLHDAPPSPPHST